MNRRRILGTRSALILASLLAAPLALGEGDKGEAPAGPGEDAREAQRKRLMDNELWHGRMIVVIRGSGQTSGSSGSASFSIVHEAEVHFLVRIAKYEAQSLAMLEQMRQMFPDKVKQSDYEKLRNTRHWTSGPTERKPEDEDDVRLVVHDKYEAEGEGGCGKKMHYHDTWTLDGDPPKEREKLVHQLAIDMKKGTYDLLLDGRSDQLILTEVDSPTGKPPKTTVGPGSAATIPLQVKGWKLPEDGNVLSGTIPLSKKELNLRRTWDFGPISGAKAWTLSPEPLDDLLAVPWVAPVERGKPSRLDGSLSKGKITKYIWTIKPLPPAPDAVCTDEATERTFETAESAVEVTLLGPCEVTLKVSNGERTSKPAKTDAVVKPREWETDVKHESEAEENARLGARDAKMKELKKEGELDKDGWAAVQGMEMDGGLTHGGKECEFGRNLCSIGHGAAINVGHVYHQDPPEDKYWIHDAYEVLEVADPRSPFDGWTYVSENKVRIHRRSIFTRDLMPGSSTWNENTKSRPHMAAYFRLVASVKAHERLHTDLFREQAMKKDFDPARKIEKIYCKDAEKVKDEADTAMRDAAGWFDSNAAALEQKVHEKLAAKGLKGPVTVLLKKGEAFEDWTFPDISALGD